MQQSLSWETDGFVGEPRYFPDFVNSEVQYCTYKIPSLAFILHQINPKSITVLKKIPSLVFILYQINAKSIPVLTKSRHLPLPFIRLIRSPLPYLKNPVTCLYPLSDSSRPRQRPFLFIWSFLMSSRLRLDITIKIRYAFFHVCYIPLPSHPPRSRVVNVIQWGVQTVQHTLFQPVIKVPFLLLNFRHRASSV